METSGFRQKYISSLKREGIIYGQEALAAALSNAFGGKPMEEVAENLMEHFPSMNAALHAGFEELMAVDGVDERIALYIMALGRVKISKKCDVQCISGTKDFIGKLGEHFKGCENEKAECYLVNSRGKVVAWKGFTSSSKESVLIPPEEFAAFLSENRATGLYIAHNHVVGDCRPSRADDVITERISRICALCGIKFFDHAIFDSRGGVYSYSEENKLK